MRGNDGVEGDAQFGFPAGGDTFDARFEITCGAQQMPFFAQQFASGCGEFRAMAATVEQQHVKIFFEFLHAVGEG